MLCIRVCVLLYVCSAVYETRTYGAMRGAGGNSPHLLYFSRLASCGIISPKRCNIFADGINADREATDYKHTYRQVTSDDKLQIHLAPGGGWTAIVE